MISTTSRARADVLPIIEPLETRRLLSSVGGGGIDLVAEEFATPARQVEQLGRGVVAVRSATTQAYISWRLLGSDHPDVAFNLYRSANSGTAVRLNGLPITQTTDFPDNSANFAVSNRYFVRPVVEGVEGEASESFLLPANVPVRQHLSIPLQRPAGGQTPDGVNYTYSANDGSVGDVTGDGRYEIILKWDPSNSKDNAHDGYTGNVYIDAYTLEGEMLWRIDLGRNIRAGAHYTQFIVYDFDGDGRAEIAMKTADGTIDGQGNAIGDINADWRNSAGRILSGPEYLTIFDGSTGAALATVDYVPARGSVSSWGDSYGNRVDRFLAGVAYLDGQRPSLIMSRGYYTRTVIAAWDWRDGQLTNRWVFDSNTSGNGTYAGQGAHSLSITDADGDGRDEIVFGAATINDNGTGLYSTRLGHGDALHVSDMDPARPGREIFMVYESPGSNGGIGAAMTDAATGQVLWSVPASRDIGRGVAFDVDPRHSGYEAWSTANGNLYSSTGQVISSSRPGPINFGIWWDADPLREMLDQNRIDKWNWNSNSLTGLLTASGASSNNGTKANPVLSGDILGDWREEVIFRSTDSSELRIYTTTIPAASRMHTLMHDTQYRAAIAWQNVAYNQPPHPSFFIGDGMADPPAPNIRYADGPSIQVEAYQAEEAIVVNSLIENEHAGFNGAGYVNFPADSGHVEFQNVDGGAGGETVIRLRYALGASGSRTGRIAVNGVAQDITFTSTGAWNGWAFREVQVNLLPGAANTIRLEATGQDLPNLDEMRVTLPASLPAPWSSRDIGNTGIRGVAGYHDGTFTVKGAGSDIWGAADSFRFVHQDHAGDGEIVARITTMTNTDPWAKAGVMMRAGTAANAMHAMVVQTPGNGVAFQWRSTAGGNMLSVQAAEIPVGSWVKLARSGNSFSAYYSLDGTDWVQIGSDVTINMPADVQAGLAVTSRSTGSLMTATFGDVALVQHSVPEVIDAAYHFETSPNRLGFTFSDDVSANLSIGDLSIMHGDGGAVAVVGMEYNPATNTATFTLPTPLADGVYMATLSADGVRNGGEVAMAEDFAFGFFVLAGDANRDGRVDIADLGIMASNWQQPGTFSQGDFNFSGTIDIADLGILAANWQKELDLSDMQLTLSSTTMQLSEAIVPEAHVSATPERRGPANRAHPFSDRPISAPSGLDSRSAPAPARIAELVLGEEMEEHLPASSSS